MHGSHSPRFELALGYAYRLHGTQTRKGSNIPYISHLLAVCALVLENHGSEDAAIAALLHDAVEDQGGMATAQEIGRLFGDEVRRIVMGCSDSHETPKPPWRERKERTLARLPNAPADVRLVACCDKLHNARTTLADLRHEGSDVWKRFNAGPGDQIWYYRSVIAAFRAGGGPLGVTDELERVVDLMEALARGQGTPS